MPLHVAYPASYLTWSVRSEKNVYRFPETTDGETEGGKIVEKCKILVWRNFRRHRRTSENSTSILFTKMTVKKLSRRNVARVGWQCGTTYCICASINNTDALRVKITTVYARSRYEITCVWLSSLFSLRKRLNINSSFTALFDILELHNIYYRCYALNDNM